MASEPVPEPLTNQEVKSDREAEFPASSKRGPELVSQAAPPIPAGRELPRAPRQQEWKDAVQQKVAGVKEAATRAKDTATQIAQQAKEQTSAAVSQVTTRAGEVYHDSRDKAADVIQETRVRARTFVNEHPLQVIMGVAAAAFLAGIFLRVWRSSRDA